MLALFAALVAPYFIDWTSLPQPSSSARRARSSGAASRSRERPARVCCRFPSVTFEDVSVGGGLERPARHDRRGILDGCRARTVHARRVPDLRHAAGAAEDDGLGRRRRQGRLGDAAVVAIRCRTDFPREADGHRGAGDGPACRERARPPASPRSTRRSRRSRSKARGESTVRCGSTACALRSELSTGKVDENGAMRLRVKTDPVIYPVSIETDGDVGFHRRSRRICRHHPHRGARRRRRRSRQRRRRLRPRKPRPELPAWRVRGKFTLDHERFALDEFRFETGPQNDPYTADGKAYVELDADPRFSVTATGAQVRFDETVVTEKNAGGADAAGSRRGSAGSAARPAASRSIPGLDRRRPAGGRGRRHDHSRRQDAGRAGGGRLAT